MAHTYDELQAMTVAQLREVAEGIEDERVQGASQMNKEHLLPAICEVLGIEQHVHHDVVGIDKAAIKKEIRALKKERDAAEEAHDHAKLKDTRRQIHKLKRKIRRATV